MGEMAEYLLNGDDCQVCGEYIGEGDGIPRTCAGCGGRGDGSGKRERRKRQRQRRAQRQREQLRNANLDGWEKLTDYHYRRTIDGKIVNWWPSTGKWSIDGIMQTTKKES
jgi:hypothetical protein